MRSVIESADYAIRNRYRLFSVATVFESEFELTGLQQNQRACVQRLDSRCAQSIRKRGILRARIENHASRAAPDHLVGHLNLIRGSEIECHHIQRHGDLAQRVEHGNAFDNPQGRMNRIDGVPLFPQQHQRFVTVADRFLACAEHGDIHVVAPFTLAMTVSPARTLSPIFAIASTRSAGR